MEIRLTDRVRNVMARAREEAIALRHDHVGAEHILLGLIREGDGVAVAILASLNVDAKQVRGRIIESVPEGSTPVAIRDLRLAQGAKAVLECARAEAHYMSHTYIGTEHLLIGLLNESRGPVAQTLNGMGVTLEIARAETLKLLGSDGAIGHTSP